MKKTDGILKNRQLFVIIAAVILVLGAVAGLTTYTYQQSLKEFAGDGYVLVPSEEEIVTTNVNEKYYFSAGTTYRRQLDYAILFRDTANQKVSIDTTQFVHYTDGSLSSFAKGVVMELTGLDQDQVTYYGISDKTTLIKEGMLYNMSYLGDSLQLQEFIWKIADNTYMMVAPQITLYLSSDSTVSFEDYVQIQYVDGGIVRLINEESTYQTISGEAYLRTDNGAELKLVDQMFYVNGQETVSLANMIIDSSQNLYVDEDDDTVKIPTFNVVNGKDGESGGNGQTAGSGETGAAGDNGTDGEEGAVGESGYDGAGGKNGYDGEAGDDGDAAYDGKNGIAGEDAETSASTDGIASIAQEQIPSVRLATNSYQVTNNSVLMNLSVSDPAGLLTGDLTYKIYERASMREVTSGTISRSYTNAAISYNSLLPGTEYLFLVQGAYSSGGVNYETDLFTKVFETESVGITLTLAQVTSDSITVKTVLDENSGVTSYSVVIYDKNGNEYNANVPANNKLYTTESEIVFKTGSNIDSGRTIESNAEYTVQLVNITSADWSMLSSDISLKVKTLKTTPYYEEEQRDPATGSKLEPIKNPISTRRAVVATSSRYHTVTVSLDAGISDPDNGIVGYRYELYNATSGELVDSKELAGLKTVSFDVSSETEEIQYYGRVVVLFDDNEKLVEIASDNSATQALEKIDYPKVSIIVEDENADSIVGVRYDRIAGYIYIEDAQNYLLDNISQDYPLILEFQSSSGAVFTMKKDDAAVNREKDDASRARIYFDQSELLQDTTYTITVMGPMNPTATEWNSLPSTSKNSMATTYLGGLTVKTPSPTASNVNYKWANPVDGNSFAVEFSLSDLDESSDYEIGNTEQLTFSLYNAGTGVLIGTYVWTDENTLYHESKLSQYYSSDGKTGKNIVLQDYDFTKMTGDSRVSGGGRFRIVLESGYDYTYNETLRNEHGYYNEMRYSTIPSDQEIPEIGYGEDKSTVTGSVSVEFELSPSHTVVSDPNQAITVTTIKNENVPDMYKNPDLEDDTIAAVVITPSYTWTDALRVRYYIYRMDLQETEENSKLDKDTPVEFNPDESQGPYKLYATKTFACGTTDSNNVSYGGMVGQWIAYLEDTDKNSLTKTNLDDDGQVIFERGYQYFIRYEVDCSKIMNDSVGTYPNDMSVYRNVQEDGTVIKQVPYYRSDVFALEKQAPAIYRYLDSSAEDGQHAGNIAHTWKYKIVDVDGAVNAVSEKNVHYAYCLNGDNYETVSAYTSEALQYVRDETHGAGIVNKPNGTNTYTTVHFYATDAGISLDPVLETTEGYGQVTSSVRQGDYYRIAIPYLAYKEGWNDNVKLNVSEPVRANELQELETSIKADNETMTGEYKVTGVMVKGKDKGAASGFMDEAGYQIHITLQGDKSLYKIAALRVTFTDKDNPSNVLIYDPVSIDVKNTMTGATQNYYADAYLEYAPIAAQMPLREVQVTVEAYFATGTEGYGSFAEVETNLLDTTSDKITSDDDKVWALKKIDYTDGYTERYVFMRGGLLQESGTTSPKENETYSVAENSVLIPYIADGKRSALVPLDNTDNRFEMGLAYANGAICQLRINGEETTGHITVQLGLDGTGAWIPTSDGEPGSAYYVPEKLELKKLQMDVAGEGDHTIYTYTTSCGMPGVAFDTSSSTFGVGSASIQINAKGQVAHKLGSTEVRDGLYLFLYDQNGKALPLTKYQDADGKTYYTTGDSTSPTDEKIASVKANGTKAWITNFDITVESSEGYPSYGTAITPKSGATTEGSAVFLVRGLERQTNYTFKILAKDSTGALKELYSYDTLIIGDKYSFKTSAYIDIATQSTGMVYDSYQNRYATVPFLIAGSEGYNMRIYYKIFDKETGKEVELTDTDRSTCGIGAYVTSKNNNNKKIGYPIVPLGQNVYYYSGDPEVPNNDARLPLLVSGGALEKGKIYRVEFYAYSSDNAGNNVDFSVEIGSSNREVTLPSTSTASSVIGLRTSARENSVTASWTIKNEQKSIMNDTYTVCIYPSNGSRAMAVATKTFQTNKGAVITPGSWLCDSLTKNTEYILELYADMDTDYDGLKNSELVQTVRFTTSTSAGATSYGTFEGKQLVISMTDLTNFSAVETIKYSVYSQNGTESYGNGAYTVTADDLMNGSIQIYTDFDDPKSGTTYRYQLSYCDKTGRLLGSDDGLVKY